LVSVAEATSVSVAEALITPCSRWQYHRAIALARRFWFHAATVLQSSGQQMKPLTLALTLLSLIVASAGHAAVKNVVLVHGAFADGSGWKPVADILERDGYTVYVVQEPETSLEADVAATRIVLDRSGPCVLVGHSWGGMIITEAGIHQAVRSLVYVSAFEPDVGETAGSLQNKMPPAAKSVGPVGGGFVAVKPEAFHQDFAADVPKSVAHFMSISQVPIAASSFDAKVKATAWSQKRSYAVVSTQDREINPELERFMSRRAKSETIELPGSHAIFLSHPKEVAALIEKAAKDAE
jgi:pimeloyl-ACP methyl ester carboxylesterase